jgi:hypothetical protein
LLLSSLERGVWELVGIARVLFGWFLRRRGYAGAGGSLNLPPLSSAWRQDLFMLTMNGKPTVAELPIEDFARALGGR